MVDRIKESDWKLFRQKLPGWQEAYMEKLLEGYAELIASDGAASYRFWELDKLIKQDKKNSGVIIVGLSRSQAINQIVGLIEDGVITLDDLDEFSDETRERVIRIHEILHMEFKDVGEEDDE